MRRRSSSSRWACVALGLRAVPALGRELLEALLDDRQVGDGELEVEVVDVAPRVGRRRGGRIVEGAGDVEERVGVADQGEDVRVDRALARRTGRDGDVDVGDVGVGRLLRVEERRQPVDALVGHLHDADVRGGPADPEKPPVSAWPPVSALKTVVFPLPGRPTIVTCTGASSRPRGRRRCAAARRPGRGAGCR